MVSTSGGVVFIFGVFLFSRNVVSGYIGIACGLCIVSGTKSSVSAKIICWNGLPPPRVLPPSGILVVVCGGFLNWFILGAVDC